MKQILEDQLIWEGYQSIPGILLKSGHHGYSLICPSDLVARALISNGIFTQDKLMQDRYKCEDLGLFLHHSLNEWVIYPISHTYTYTSMPLAALNSFEIKEILKKLAHLPVIADVIKSLENDHELDLDI